MPDYPIAENRKERLRTPSGLSFDSLTLEAVLEGNVKLEDLRVTAEALRMQAEIAEKARRPQLAANLRRAAELVNVPEQRILEIYNALRPGRASREALLDLAADLESRYGARLCAEFIREAAESGV